MKQALMSICKVSAVSLASLFLLPTAAIAMPVATTIAPNINESYADWILRVENQFVIPNGAASVPLPFGGAIAGQISAPPMTFTSAPGVGDLAVSNIGTSEGKVQFVEDLFVNSTDFSDFNIDIASPVGVIGFGISSIHFSGFPDANSVFELNILSGGSSIGVLNVNTSSVAGISPIFEADVMPGYLFVGISSNQPFDRIEIREVFGGIQKTSQFGGSLDTETFGAFYLPQIPGPSALALLAMVCPVLARRRRS